MSEWHVGPDTYTVHTARTPRLLTRALLLRCQRTPPSFYAARGEGYCKAKELYVWSKCARASFSRRCSLRARHSRRRALSPCRLDVAMRFFTDIALDDGDRPVLRLRQAGGAGCSSSAEANVVEVAWPVAANLQA